MIPVKIADGVYSLRSIDWDRKLFDELVPLPEGTSYNSYLVRGSDKTALIDTTYPAKTAEYIAALKRMNLGRLDYVVSNHAEPDHSGSIPAVLELFPDARVVTNARCKAMICDALQVAKSAFIEVKDGEQVSLGDRTLRFVFTPWVHWPETMATFIEEDRILFPCDFLGSHLATTEPFVVDEAAVAIAAKRYYAEIMMPYRVHARNALQRVIDLDPVMIAPSHGPIHARPAFILDLYRRWMSDEVRPEVVIPYVSMYDNTARMVEYLVDRLMEKGLSARPFNVVEFDSGALSMALVEASTIVFATPTVLAGPHPGMAHAAFLVNALAPKTRFAAIIGSYGWGTTMPELLMDQLRDFKATFFDPVLIKGLPREETFVGLDRLANDIAQANFTGTAVETST
jgi:flavorubredoxin